MNRLSLIKPETLNEKLSAIDETKFPNRGPYPWWSKRINAWPITIVWICYFCETPIKAKDTRFQFTLKNKEWRHSHKNCAPKIWRDTLNAWLAANGRGIEEKNEDPLTTEKESLYSAEFKDEELPLPAPIAIAEKPEPIVVSLPFNPHYKWNDIKHLFEPGNNFRVILAPPTKEVKP